MVDRVAAEEWVGVIGGTKTRMPHDGVGLRYPFFNAAYLGSSAHAP